MGVPSISFDELLSRFERSYDEPFVVSAFLQESDTQIVRAGGIDRDEFFGAWWPTNGKDASKQNSEFNKHYTPQEEDVNHVLGELKGYSPELMLLPWSRNKRAESLLGDHRYRGEDGLVCIYCENERELRVARILDGSIRWWWVGTVSGRDHALDEAERVRIKHLISTDQFYTHVIDEDATPTDGGHDAKTH